MALGPWLSHGPHSQPRLLTVQCQPGSAMAQAYMELLGLGQDSYTNGIYHWCSCAQGTATQYPGQHGVLRYWV